MTAQLSWHERRARSSLRRAWVSVGITPVAVVGAMVLGEWLLTRQGYDSGDSDIPRLVMLTAGGPAVLLLLAPCLAAVGFGLQARRRGAVNWLIPTLIGGVLAAAFVVQNSLGVLFTCPDPHPGPPQAPPQSQSRAVRAGRPLREQPQRGQFRPP